MTSSAEQARLDVLGRAQLALLGFDEAFARRVRRRIDEGLDATAMKIFQHEGALIEGPVQVDFTERRLAAELSARLLDWMPNKLEHEVHGEIVLRTIGLSEESV